MAPLKKFHKAIFLFCLTVLSFSSFAQLKVTQPIIYYKDASFVISPLIPPASTNTAAVPLKQMRDSIAAAIAGGGAGTVISVGSGLGLSGTVTTSGTLSLDTANASVLSRQRAANMYTPKSHEGSTGTAHGNSTTSVSGFMSSADKTKLDGVAPGATSNTGTVTSVSSGLGLTGTVTTSGTLSLDTANSSVLSRQRAANTYQPKGNYGAGTVTSVGSGLGLAGTVTTSGTLALDTANASVLSRQRANNTYAKKNSFAYIISNVSTSSTTLTDITGLSLPLEANSLYEIEVNLNAGTDASGTFVGVGLNLSNTTNAAVWGSLTGTAVIATYSAARVGLVNSFNVTDIAFFSSGNSVGAIIFHGLVSTGSTAPTIVVRFQIAAGTVSVYPLSYIKATKVQ